MNRLRIKDILIISFLYQEIIGQGPIINLGGLEPLLWYQRPSLRIHDLVNALSTAGFEVYITTNGSLLSEFAEKLADAGLSKCRISVHNFNQRIYQRITGYNTLSQILKSIKYLRLRGVTISLNRTLLKGYTNDLPQMLDFVTEYGLTLKLYELLWTEWISEEWEQYYIPWQEIVQQYVLPRTVKTSLSRKKFHRPRLQYFLQGGGIVEVKVFSEKLHDKLPICAKCPFNSVCQETIGAYVYVTPDMKMTFCHYRPDLYINLSSIISLEYQQALISLQTQFENVLGKQWQDVLREGKLTFYINESCNYFCGFPDREKHTERLWCMSSLRVEEN